MGPVNLQEIDSICTQPLQTLFTFLFQRMIFDAMDKLRTKTNQLNQLLQIVSHDVINPLSVILGICRKAERQGGNIDEKGRSKIRNVVGIERVTDEDELLMVTSKGNIIRMAVNEISVIGRNTQGVRLARMQEDTQVVGVEKFVE